MCEPSFDKRASLHPAARTPIFFSAIYSTNR